MDIKSIFKDFVQHCEQNYNIGNVKIYNAQSLTQGTEDCINLHLKTEADIKVKFGSFLENKLKKTKSSLTVHSELRVYDNRHLYADLSVHDISGQQFWNDRDDYMKSCKAVIEIKYKNFKQPHFNLQNIQSDIKKLSLLPAKIEKVLIVLDEANGINNKKANLITNMAIGTGVVLLSNNKNIK